MPNTNLAEYFQMFLNNSLATFYVYSKMKRIRIYSARFVKNQPTSFRSLELYAIFELFVLVFTCLGTILGFYPGF
jgi:hypothetical protein